MHFCAQHGLVQQAELLLDSGHDVDSVDRKLRTPLHTAVARDKVIQVLTCFQVTMEKLMLKVYDNIL